MGRRDSDPMTTQMYVCLYTLQLDSLPLAFDSGHDFSIDISICIFFMINSNISSVWYPYPVNNLLYIFRCVSPVIPLWWLVPWYVCWSFNFQLNSTRKIPMECVWWMALIPMCTAVWLYVSWSSLIKAHIGLPKNGTPVSIFAPGVGDKCKIQIISI